MNDIRINDDSDYDKLFCFLLHLYNNYAAVAVADTIHYSSLEHQSRCCCGANLSY